MKSKHFLYLLSLGSMILLLAGCGAGGTTPVTKDVLSESTHCINCHEEANGKTTPGTGINVVTEWRRSSHMTANGAGCTNCHDDGFMHTTVPGSCSKCHTAGQSQNPTNNPDRDNKCANCHTKLDPRGFKTLTYTNSGIPAGSTTAFTHFSTGRHGMYVSTEYKRYCRKCHNPHDTESSKKLLREWAVSGHGSTRSLFVIDASHLKTRGSVLPLKDTFGNVCVRCHTTTGYVKFTKADPRNGELFSEVQALPDFNGTKSNYPQALSGSTTYVDKSREGINCNACHSDGRDVGTPNPNDPKDPYDESAYGGKVRAIPPFSVWFTYSSHPIGVSSIIRAKMNIQFDSLATSNLCGICHSGREAGDIIKLADRQGFFNFTGSTNLRRPSGISPHDFAAGGNLQGMNGFHFYTSSTKYTSDPTHKTASTIIGGASGACIGCHMKNDQPHLFRPVTWRNNNLYETILAVPSESTTCIRCHAGPETGLNANPRRGVDFMNTQRDNYRAAVVALGTMIPANRNWNIFGPAIVPGSGPGPGLTGADAIHTGAYTMGANFVYNQFLTDPGGYTHNPTYTKQLIYDSIDWLYDGKMDYGTASSQVYNKINAISTSSLTYSRGVPAVIYGQNGIPISAGGVPFTKTQALSFICKGYDISNPTVCNRY